MSIIELQVKGMTCGSCVASVTRALQRVPGVTDIDVDLPAGLVQVETAGGAGPQPAVPGALVAALAAAGYPAVSTELGAMSPAPLSASSHCGSEDSQGAVGHRGGGCCCGH